jgi:hypothetical protein
VTAVSSSDSGHASEGLVKVLAGPPGPGSATAFHPHPPPLPPPAPTGPRTHGPKLTIVAPGRTFKKVTHAH